MAGLAERVKNSALYEDLRSDLPRVEVLGNGAVRVENHCGLLEYEDTCIRVRYQGGVIGIMGASLAITALAQGVLAVRGTIASIEFRTEG